MNKGRGQTGQAGQAERMRVASILSLHGDEDEKKTPDGNTHTKQH